MSILRRDVKQKLHKNLGEMVAYLDRSHAVNIHFHKNPTQFGSYLGGTADMKWVKWEVTDCVFAAMLNVMGLRFEGSGDVEAIEKKIEEDLAVELSIPKTAVEDHTLILLMESKLGWRKLLEVTDLASLLANTLPGKKYIVSYCENTTTDFWHTIYAERKAHDFTWVDRQYERKEGKVRTGALKGDPASEAVCWEVDEYSTLLDSLKFKLKVDTLASTHAEHLG